MATGRPMVLSELAAVELETVCLSLRALARPRSRLDRRLPSLPRLLAPDYPIPLTGIEIDLQRLSNGFRLVLGGDTRRRRIKVTQRL